MIVPLLAVLTAVAAPARIHMPVPRHLQVAQTTYNGRSNELRVRSLRLDDAGLVIDGRLDEPQWARAALLTGFSQFSPNDGAPAPEGARRCEEASAKLGGRAGRANGSRLAWRKRFERGDDEREGLIRAV